MFIKLLEQDVPRYWEIIKFVANEVEEIPEEKRATYMNELLISLLNAHKQCFIRVSDDKKELQMMVITEILENKDWNEKYLYVKCLYSWLSVPEETWLRNIEVLKAFAKNVGCSYIGAVANVGRAQEIMLSIGFCERNRIYALRLE